MAESDNRSIGARRTGSGVTRFFGGSPLAVLLRLVLVSILVGFLLDVFGLDPLDIFDSLRRMVYRVWYMGFDALHWLWRYLLLGAVIVVPIWLLMRLFNAPRGR